MSNLGAYQTMTTTAKAVGGPYNLAGLLVGAGAVIGTGIGCGVALLAPRIKKAVIDLKERYQEQRQLRLSQKYTATTSGISNEGLQFAAGDAFVVLAQDDDAVLIEKVGEEGNPYFVSADLLRKISNFN
ncbi:MAG: hypothetical protein IJD05_07080 [Bacteroidaceae bacterium]|nr:hypothetical protein [Bacteroidaceae bacterium]